MVYPVIISFFRRYSQDHKSQPQLYVLSTHEIFVLGGTTTLASEPESFPKLRSKFNVLF